MSNTVATVSMIVAEEYGLPAERRRENPLAAPLHDVGKIGAPGAILNKPAWLNQNEIAQVRRRVTYGAEILATRAATSSEPRPTPP
jgi:putative two-component system response regulator